MIESLHTVLTNGDAKAYQQQRLHALGLGRGFCGCRRVGRCGQKYSFWDQYS